MKCFLSSIAVLSLVTAVACGGGTETPESPGQGPAEEAGEEIDEGAEEVEEGAEEVGEEVEEAAEDVAD